MPIPNCENGHYYNTDMYKDKCPICGGRLLEDEHGEKVAEGLKVAPQDRVCGWLVCVKGVNKGRDYKIRPGKNFIGSGNAMKICIKGDKRVYKRNHAILLYDSKTSKMMLLPGDSHGMVYLENQAIYEPTEVKDFNDIEIGDSVFKFAPFCSGGLNWEDFEDDNKAK